MFKYIGIRGHRGAGKNTFSYLLGVALDYYIKNQKFDEGFEVVYNQAVEKVLEMNEDFIETSELTNVFFESFADTAKVALSQTIGLPLDYLYNDWCKDSVFVNLVDFSFVQAKDKLEVQQQLTRAYTAQELYNYVIKSEDSPFTTDRYIYIQLRELITYYSKYLMQTFFGRNVWVKSLEVNKWDLERFYAGNNKTVYKIFTDCKFTSEISYILNNRGTIIKVNRENNVKQNTEISNELADDQRFDYQIDWQGDLYDPQVIENIKSLTLKIINK